MSGPRFYIVTNDPARAALEFWCHPGNLPASIVVTDNPDLWMKIPDGAQVRCLWFGSRAALEPWENFWWSRRVKGGFDWISDADWNQIMEWAERARKAPCLLLNQGIGLDAVVEDIAPAAVVAAETPVSPRGGKWH